MEWENYKITNGLAFTSDKYLIYNLILHNLPKAITYSEVLNNFQQFGEVVKVKFLRGIKQKCVIQFAHAEDATNVLLQSTNLNSSSYSIIENIQPCESFYQPKGQTLIKQLEATIKNESSAAATFSEIDQEAALHLHLSNDCLAHICKMLPPADQANFGATCQRFCNILIMTSRTQYAKVNLKELITGCPLLTIEILFRIVGPQIKMFDIAGLFTTIKLTKICAFCPNVEKLTLKHLSNEDIFVLPQMIENMQHLQDLELHFCNTADDNFIKDLQRLSNLKRLRINENDYITSSQIQHLSGLEKLELIRCYNITAWDFENICESLKNLYYLDIRNFYCDYAEAYECLSEHLPQLKILKTSCSDGNFSFIEHLPKLESLVIEIDADIIEDEFSSNLTKYLCNRWNEFRLSVFGRSLTKNHILEIAKLEKLKFLNCKWSAYDYDILDILETCLHMEHMRLYDNRFTDDSVNKIFKLLQEQWNRGLRSDCVQLDLIADFSGAKAPSWELKEHSDILKINYCQSSKD